jgi:hypothetical protein
MEHLVHQRLADYVAELELELSSSRAQTSCFDDAEAASCNAREAVLEDVVNRLKSLQSAGGVQ